ncbi:BadF/BadG/BcrA/BcrD ATPase family protein [Silicimonas sp. MF1-12-2]|uniref:BadF/BadG/BcrA/BcrD ATPase family protein n=1 Tax=Silicimonas sp. MF1-12-2 TaxID=3384793 RepID=UPI0039B605DA
MTNRPEIIAIDGGGTRCRVACLRSGKRTLIEVSSANASTDLAGTIEQVNKGLALLAERLSLTTGDLAQIPAFVGLAGMVGPEIRQAIADGIHLSHARIEDDRPAAVRGALGREDGAIAHCGTGSFFAVQQDGAIRLSGGWGPILGDEASAQWLGRKALLAALDVADGLRPPSPLAEALLREHGSTAGIVSFAASATPARFGELAPKVTKAAQSEDPLALKLLKHGADHIARTLTDMGWTSPLPICLTGGLAPRYEQFLPHDMRSAIAPAKGEPIDGALSLAQDLRREMSA